MQDTKTLTIVHVSILFLIQVKCGSVFSCLILECLVLPFYSKEGVLNDWGNTEDLIREFNGRFIPIVI